MSSYFSYPLEGTASAGSSRFLESRPPRDWERIARYGERLRFSAGDPVLKAGETDTSFAIVLTGSLIVELPSRPDLPRRLRRPVGETSGARPEHRPRARPDRRRASPAGEPSRAISDGDAPLLIEAVQGGRDLGGALERVRAGDWGALAG